MRRRRLVTGGNHNGSSEEKDFAFQKNEAPFQRLEA